MDYKVPAEPVELDQRLNSLREWLAWLGLNASVLAVWHFLI